MTVALRSEVDNALIIVWLKECLFNTFWRSKVALRLRLRDILGCHNAIDVANSLHLADPFHRFIKVVECEASIIFAIRFPNWHVIENMV